MLFKAFKTRSSDIQAATEPRKCRPRYEDLAERNTEGRLSPGEQNELAAIVRANSLLTVLKAEARAFLQHPNAA